MKRGILLGMALLSAVAVARADDTNAKANWQKHCAMCHGKDGQANTAAGKMLGAADLQDAKVQASFTDDQASKAIKEGIKKDGRQKMKSFGDELSDKDIRELVKYVRTLKKSK